MFSAAKTAGPSGYNISRSVRLRSSASAYFSRTPASASNRKTWTWSAWVKRGAFATQDLFNAYQDANNQTLIAFSSDTLIIYTIHGGGSFDYGFQTTAVFRDPSAWYHIVCVFDSTNATAANRAIVYVNGVQQAGSMAFGDIPLNQDGIVNSTNAHAIGRRGNATNYFDGYLTEINFIDGQALTPSSFGSTNATTGVWQPAKYTGTYGTNGFYLNFSDNSAATAAAIGKDYSGNGNNWTPNNISVTAGATYDSMIDVPTPYPDGSTNRGNYAVLNPLRQNGSGTFAQGNLAGTSESGTQRGLCSSIVLDWAGKWYMEWTPASNSGNWFGVTANSILAADINTAGQQSVLYYASNGNKFVNGTGTAYGSSYTTQTIGIAFDGPAGTITFYRDNVSQGAITLPSSTVDYVFCMGNGVTSGITNFANFGQRPFTYTPPSGFKALNTYNLPSSTITNGGKYMAATTYTGTGAARSVVNAGAFQPDLVWMKDRGNVVSNILFDSQRGTNNFLRSNTTDAATTNTTMLTAFNSNGFSLGTDSAGAVNVNTNSYVGWQWQAGQGSTSSNANGTITSTVSVNATAGFSVVSFTGLNTGGTAATMGHGLGVAPSFIIIKNRDIVDGWYCYHASLGNTAYIILNTTAAQQTGSNLWSSTSPTSTVFTLRQGNLNTSTSDKLIAYCWAQIAGFSKFGSYTGNGSADGPFVYCGFRPRWLMIKRTDTAGFDWFVYDSSRDAYNVVQNNLRPNTSGAESAQSANYIDLLSNGFKLKGDNTGSTNNTSGTFIYAAFAENPFANALAR